MQLPVTAFLGNSWKIGTAMLHAQDPLLDLNIGNQLPKSTPIPSPRPKDLPQPASNPSPAIMDSIETLSQSGQNSQWNLLSCGRWVAKNDGTILSNQGPPGQDGQMALLVLAVCLEQLVLVVLLVS